MSITPEEPPLYSPPVFVGRDYEINLFKEMLAHPEREEEWILHIQADGGMGKTKLLEVYQSIAKENSNVLFNQQLFDFYHTAYQSETGLMEAIAKQLAPTQFETFFEKLKIFRSDKKDLQPEEEVSIEQLRSQFIEDYAQLNADAIILFFDTYEEAGDAAKRFCTDLLPKLHEAKDSTLIIKAGRPEANFVESEHSRLIDLKELNKQELDNYLEIRHLSVSDEVKNKLLEFWQGKPILLDLFTDWCNNGNNPDELLQVTSTKAFEKKLIMQTSELYFPENQAIFLMAQFYRRFNAEILAFLLGKTIEEAKEIIEKLIRFSFVKYRPATIDDEESCLLHDEMRRLMNDYEWKDIDATGLYRIEKTNALIDWYDAKIQQEQNLTQKAHFEVETLFYKLSLNINNGFKYWHTLVRDAYRGYWELMELLNKELKRPEFRQNLTQEQAIELNLRRAYVRFDRGAVDGSVSLLENILTNHAASIYIRAKSLAKLIQAYAMLGNVKRAFDLYNSYSDFTIDDNASDINKDLMNNHLGMIKNNIGYTYKISGNLEMAKSSYRDAIAYFKKVTKPDDYKTGDYLARTENNLGFLLHLSGDDEEATAFCTRALKRRKKIDDKRQIGLSYNTLGIIHSDGLSHPIAKGNFDLARSCFDEANSKRGKALVAIAEGRMNRQIAWYKKANPDADDAQSISHSLIKAEKLLDEAIDILTSKKISQSDLADAYHEKGILCHEQKNYSSAIEFFNKALKLRIEITLSVAIENDYFIAYTLQSLGEAYFYVDIEQALYYSNESIKSGKNHPHVLAPAYRVLADIAFNQANYDKSFEYVANSLLNRIKEDPNSQDDSQAKRSFLYEDWLLWIESLLDRIESGQLKEHYGQYLIDKVMNGEGFINKKVFRFRIETICDL